MKARIYHTPMSYAIPWDYERKYCEWISDFSKLEPPGKQCKHRVQFVKGFIRNLQDYPYDADLDLSYMMEVEKYLYPYGMTL